MHTRILLLTLACLLPVAAPVHAQETVGDSEVPETGEGEPGVAAPSEGEVSPEVETGEEPAADSTEARSAAPESTEAEEGQEVQVDARRTVELDATLDVAEETTVEQPTTVEQTTIERTTIEPTIERPPLPVGVFWGGVALSVVTAGVGGYFGFSALTLANTERGRDVRLPPDTSGIEEAALVADVFYATAFVFAVATAIAALFTDWDRPEEEDPSEDTEADPDPDAPSARWTGLGLEGSF